MTTTSCCRRRLLFLYYGCLFVPSPIAAFVVTPSSPPPRTPTTAVFFTDHDEGDNTIVTTTMPSSWQTILDINQDGKVDCKDFTCLLTKTFDVNGDGVVDEKDAQTALGMTLLSWLLMVSPAHAKGGGSGRSSGGGYSTYHSSTYHSREYEYASYRRRWWNQFRTNDRSISPLVTCSDLPLEGENIDVLVDKRRGAYRPGVAQNVKLTSCEFQAKTMDNDDMAFLSSHEKMRVNWILPSFIGACIVDADAKSREDLEWREEFDSQFLMEQENISEKNTLLPKSGLYYGETTESDGVAQEVEMTLTFLENGAITGHGYDATDGSYTIQGSWTENKVKWTEQYDDFTVTVRGTRNPHNSLSCRFTSTTGVSGNFQMQT